MGLNFTNNGEFYSWSPLFDYSSSETAKASLYLPTPNKVKLQINTKNKNNINISSQMNELRDIYRQIKNYANANDKTNLIDDIKPKDNTIGDKIKFDIIQPYLSETQFGKLVDLSRKFDIETDEKTKKKLRIELKKLLKSIHSELQNKINDLKTKKIFNLSSLIMMIDDNVYDGKSYITYDVIDDFKNETNQIISDIENHENYTIFADQLDSTYKNAVASRIMQIVNDSKNVSLAYSPITMDDLQSYAENSPKGNLVSELTSMNPITKMIMQNQNMAGKTVIGIAAVGEKVYMSLTYYHNEGLLSHNSTYQRRMQFWNTTTRIQDRSIGQPKFTVKTGKADTILRDTYGFSYSDLRDRILQIEEIRKQYGNQADDYINNNRNNFTKADLMISQLLSAATDNAKELILDKINAGEKLAKIYLHLLILGYSMNDIYSFMTSPAISLMASLLEEDVFESTYIRKPNDVKNILDNGYNQKQYKEGDSEISLTNIVDELSNFFKEKELSYFSNGNLDTPAEKLEAERKQRLFINLQSKTLIEELLHNTHGYQNIIIFQLTKLLNNNFEINNPTYNYLTDMIALSEEKMNALYNQYKDKDEKIQDYYPGKTIKEKEELFNEDIEEFINLFNAADETSTLGQLLGWAKEVKVDPAEFMLKINSFEQILFEANRDFKYTDSNEKQHQGLNLTDDCINEIIKRHPNYNQSDIDSKINKEWVRDRIKEAMSSEYNILRKLKDQNDNEEENYSATIDFVRYNEDKDYRELVIDLYDFLKSCWNVYDVIGRVPQYNAAIRAYYLNLKYLQHSSIKGKLINLIRQEERRYLSKDQVNGIIDYTDSLLVYRFLQDKNYTFPLLEGYEYINEEMQTMTNLESDPKHEIKKVSDIFSFKVWFENTLLSQMLNSRVKLHDDPSSPDTQYLELYDNEFIKYLQTGLDRGIVIKQLNMFMDRISTNANTAQKYARIVSAYNKLPVQIKNWFMLYNLITSKNSPGRDRMTGLFSVSMNQQQITGVIPLIQEFSDFIANLDLNPALINTDSGKFLRDMGYRKNDVMFNIMPACSEYNEWKHKELFIRSIRRGRSTVKIKRNGSYEEYKGYLPSSIASNENKKIIAMENILTHGSIFLPTLNDSANIQNLLNSDKEEELIAAIRQVILDKKLSMLINC